MVTLSFTIFSGQKNYNRAHMLFQVLCGFEPIFYTTHPNEEPLQKKINRHKQSILNTIDYGLTNARFEAINNKIKLSIRMAYGFRNLDNMMAMIMLRCSDIKVQLPWEKDEWSSFFCFG